MHMERRLAMLRSRTFVSENKLKLLFTALCVVAGLAVFLQVVMCHVSIMYDIIPNLFFVCADHFNVTLCMWYYSYYSYID